MQLWHLDEAGTPCTNALAGGISLAVLANGAALGNASFPGFVNALNTADAGQAGTVLADKDALLSALPLVNGTGDDAPVTLDDITTGSFTFEAVVRVDFDPLLNLSGRGSGMQIFSGEGDGSVDRVFQWRLDPVGYGPGDTTVPRLEFINLRQGGSIQSIVIPIPTNGPNAIASNQWYHVAATYNGSDSTAENFRAYWTSLTNETGLANLIGTATLLNDLALASCDFVVGNEGRATGGSSDNFVGLIDEVRISRAARDPNEFVFRGLPLVTASGYEAGTTNFPGNTLDGNLNSRWSAGGDGEWISFDLGRYDLAQSVDIAFHQGDTRVAVFDVLLSNDNLDWRTALSSNVSSGTTLALQSFDFADWPARYVRIVGHGNSVNNVNSFTEVVIHSTTPPDTDADGLPDVWELFYFTNLTQTLAGDPDADMLSNADEFLRGTDPNQPTDFGDLDHDGLPDDWELTHFGSLAESALDDFDGDGHSNLQELQYDTNPASTASFPVGPAVTYIPIEDGNPTTSEYGYAGSSSINTVNFVHNALHTENGQQFIAYYYRHATNPGDPNNNRIVIARRNLDTNHWQMFFTTFTANAITDGHDVASFGIDGAGYMHLSWGMHGDAFHYSRSTTPVFGTNPIVFGPDTTMTGRENSVTYPQWLRLPEGDLLYLFREGASGNGDTFLNRYHVASQTWSNVHHSGSTQLPFLKGTGWTPNYNAYPNMPQLDDDGTFHLVWTWRYQSDSPAGESGYQTNHDFDYARSTDGGLTWLRQNGVPYALPISELGENGDPNTMAEKILNIPEGYSLINQAGMYLDQNRSPVIATWWAPGTSTNNFRRQYMVSFRDTNGLWQVRQVSNRTNDPTGTKYSETYVRNLGRPVIVCDREGRLIVLYRDNAGSNGLTIVHSLPYARDPRRTNWTTIDLTTANLGNYEPVIDESRWELDERLHIVYQPSQGEGYTPPANTAAPIAVVEWNAAAYFAHRPTLQVSFVNSTNALLTFNSQLNWQYRVQTSTNLTTWQTLATLDGISGLQQFTHTNSVGSSRRFWRIETREGGFGP